MLPGCNHLKCDHVSVSVLSLIMMVVIRYISKVLVWILTILVIVGSIGMCSKTSILNYFWKIDILNMLVLFLLCFIFHFPNARKQHWMILHWDYIWASSALILQVGLASFGGSMWTTEKLLTITHYQCLGRKWPQTMLRLCSYMQLALQSLRYVWVFILLWFHSSPNI